MVYNSKRSNGGGGASSSNIEHLLANLGLTNMDAGSDFLSQFAQTSDPGASAFNLAGPGSGMGGGSTSLPPMNIEPQTTIRGRTPKSQSSLDILDQLVQSMLTDSASGSFDYESALQQQEDAIRQAYGAEIGAIRSNNRAARRDTKRARKDVEAMYAGLAKSYGRQANKAHRQGEKNAQGAINVANKTNDIIRKNQSDITGQEAQMLNDLGLQATADQVIQPDFDKLRQVTAKNSAEGNRRAQSERQFGNIDERFFNRGGQGVLFEGDNRSADLLASLQDYLRQNNNQIAGLRGQQGKEIASGKNALMQGAAEAQADADNETWDRLMQYMGLKANIENTDFDNKLAAKKFRADQQTNPGTSDFLPDNMQKAAGVLQGGSNPQAMMDILNSLTGTASFRYGQAQAPNGQTYKLTPFEAAAMAEKAGKQAKLSPQDINLLKLAAMQAVG